MEIYDNVLFRNTNNITNNLACICSMSDTMVYCRIQADLFKFNCFTSNNYSMNINPKTDIKIYKQIVNGIDYYAVFSPVKNYLINSLNGYRDMSFDDYKFIKDNYTEIEATQEISDIIGLLLFRFFQKTINI